MGNVTTRCLSRHSPAYFVKAVAARISFLFLFIFISCRYPLGFLFFSKSVYYICTPSKSTRFTLLRGNHECRHLTVCTSIRNRFVRYHWVP
ncbi:hypothetical protein BDN72DRAFT_655041 [Pluteus cervinus]|uniref:Uncharacterized protein n=1 Tax=Pluteus cervinus TaxID=181527 RepID=A0ACD3A0U0_9AGAR|nr:hypothetical protein BDN72DRAFT_655041 [Pluteus cervinus]